MKVKLLNKSQLLNKKIIIPVAIIAVIGVVSLSVMAAKPTAQPTLQSETTPASSVATTPDTATQSTPVTQTPTTTTPIVTTDPVPPPATPEYGVDANNSSIFEVFDKTAVMTDAGIPTDQQADAQAALNIIRGNTWVYKMSDDTQAFWDDICRITPPAPQDKSIPIPPITDYRDSPVIQLKFCNIHAQDKYGSWTSVLDILHNHGVFN